MICLVEQTDETDECNEEDQLRRLENIYDVTPPPSRRRKKVDLPICLDTPSKSSKRVKEIPLGMVYYFILLCMKKDVYIFVFCIRSAWTTTTIQSAIKHSILPRS